MQPKPSAKKPAGKPSPAAKPSQAPPAQSVSSVKAVKLNVEVSEDIPRIVAFVMRSTNRVLATRTIELIPEGIVVKCDCEKSPCPADSWAHRPGGPNVIQEQVRGLLNALRLEYHLPLKRVDYYYLFGQQVTEGQALILPPIWRDERLLAEARDGFDRRRRGR